MQHTSTSARLLAVSLRIPSTYCSSFSFKACCNFSLHTKGEGERMYKGISNWSSSSSMQPQGIKAWLPLFSSSFSHRVNQLSNNAETNTTNSLFQCVLVFLFVQFQFLLWMEGKSDYILFMYLNEFSLCIPYTYTAKSYQYRNLAQFTWLQTW